MRWAICSFLLAIPLVYIYSSCNYKIVHESELSKPQTDPRPVKVRVLSHWLYRFECEEASSWHCGFTLKNCIAHTSDMKDEVFTMVCVSNVIIDKE